MSYTDRLVAVRTAIDELVAGGQSVTYQGRTLSMASLDSLMKLEEKYSNMAAAEGMPTSQKGRSRIIYVTPST